jgi:hypothetical protein
MLSRSTLVSLIEIAGSRARVENRGGRVDEAGCFDRKFRQEVLRGSWSLNEETPAMQAFLV